MEISRKVDFGVYLKKEDVEILLPKNKVPANAKVGQILNVFIYKDSENRLIATTDTPKILVNQCAFLQVKDVNKYGAFLDWGIENQLLVPFREQTSALKKNHSYIVFLYLDPVSERLVATTRIEKRMGTKVNVFKPKEKVNLLIYQKVPLGFKAIINQIQIGLLYSNEIFQPLEIGQQLDGYIRTIRSDHKIDLCLTAPSIAGLMDTADQLLFHLKENNGTLPLTDKSSPDEIRSRLNISKAHFKKAVGILLKKKLILADENHISLTGYKSDTD